MSFTLMRPRRFIAHAVFALSFVGPAFAATYTQDFSAAPSSWTVFDDSTAVTDTFIVSSGAYTNTQGAGMTAPFRSVAYYNGATWNTNYTYTVKLNSDYEGDGNRVGVVWSLQDSGNYYEVSVAMRTYTNTNPRTIVNTGNATLYKVTGGSHTPIATFTATGVPWPENDTNFPVEVTRRTTTGTTPVTTTRISVGGVLAFKSTTLNDYGAGYVGFFAQHNTGRFDDVKVVDAVPLFKSGFESGVTNTGPTCIGTAPNQTQFEDLSGADITGYHWNNDLSFWGAARAPMFNTAVSCSYTYTDYIAISIGGVTSGPTGGSTNVLLNTVNKWHQPTTADEPRAGANYVFNAPTSSDTPYYIRRYLQYPSDMLTKMGNGSWFAQHEYKTNCSALAYFPGRLVVYWRQDIPNGVDKVPYYQLARDQNINCTPPLARWVEELYARGERNLPADAAWHVVLRRVLCELSHGWLGRRREICDQRQHGVQRNQCPARRRSAVTAGSGEADAGLHEHEWHRGQGGRPGDVDGPAVRDVPVRSAGSRPVIGKR